ncbi:MAG: DUF11 domain-containing protein, partial [Xanthomonadaceae bacterium]|nr:DUF11 domain-containing protein [Xanthomonadaceae bacterium]
TALGLPLSPPSPQVSGVAFNGLQSGNQTYVGGGGTFTFTAANDTTYQIVISAGVDFDPANPANATLTGLAPNGTDSVPWSGLANNGSAFPPGTFNFQITGRNGEIHFPIIDDEGSANGGPVLTKLNGTPTGDHTVYYDDRGYKTSAGVSIGTPGGLLCPANPPVPPTPDHSLIGQDSSAQTFSGPNCNGGTGTCFYRYWPGNGNSNTDCAATAGFGDAKALDLWAFQSTPVQSSTVVINPSNLTLAKSAPASVALNTPFNYTVGLGNNSGAASGTTATVSDILPAGVIANSVAVGSGVSTVNCGTLPSVAGATLTCAVTLSASLPGGSANGTAQFTINATATAYGVATNYASVDPLGGNSPPTPGAGCTPAASCGSATTTVVAPPSIAKAFSPTTIAANGTSTLTITLSNANATALTGAAFTDTLPGGVTTQAASAATTCSPGTAGQTAGTVTLTGATIPANGSCNVTVTVTSATAGSYTNTIPAGGVTTTNGGSNTTPTSATLTVNTAANLTLSKTGPATVTAGGSVVYTIGLGNSGGTPSGTTATVSDVLPAGVVANSVAAGSGVSAVNCGTLPSAAGATLTCTLTLTAGIPAGAVNGAAAFTLTTTAPGTGGSITNYASVDPTGGGSTPPPGAGCTPATSCSSATTTVLAPVLQILKTGPATAIAGGNIVYTITVTNSGNADATNAILTDPAPAGLTFVSAGAPCAAGFPCNLGTVAIGQSITIPAITFSIASNVTGTVTNTASVTSDQTTQTSSSASTTVSAPALIVPTPIDMRWMLLTMLALVTAVGAWRLRSQA